MKKTDEQKYNEFFNKWLEEQKRRGNANPDPAKFPKSTLKYSSWESYMKTKEKIKKRLKEDYEKNPDKYRQKSQDWRKNNPEKKKQINISYKQTHKPQYTNYLRNWRNKNPERDKQQHRENYLRHRDRYNQEGKQRYYQNKEQYNKKAKLHRQKIKGIAKAQVISHYSDGKMICNCCSEAAFDFLTIDHIDGRKQHGHDHSMTGASLYRWLIKNNYPKGFQVLCWNCNTGRFRNGGLCPHLDKNAKMSDLDPQRLVALQYYSNSKVPRCVCCGETTPTFLDIDHAANDGKQHRKPNFVKWLRDNNYPKQLGLRVLCINCNCARDAREDKSCPHGEIADVQLEMNKPDMRTRCRLCRKRFTPKLLGTSQHCSYKCCQQHRKIKMLNDSFPQNSNHLFWRYLVPLDSIMKLHRNGTSLREIGRLFDLPNHKLIGRILKKQKILLAYGS